MRALWQQIQADFERTLTLHSSNTQFELLRREHPVLGRFVDTTAVLDHLHSRNGDPGDKDLILATLVAAAQRHRNDRDVATAMVWLGLWPGLDALYRRLWRFFRSDPNELASEIAGRFAMGMQRADLSRINRVAATLITNVERDIRDDLRRRWAEAATYEELPDPDEFASHASTSSSFGLPAGTDPDAVAGFVHRVLTDLIGNDADIVVAVVMMGEGQRDVADRLGLGYDAVRKRYQRALARLRDVLGEI
ncbi:putative DNA-directed RNA polymerase specialized sigma subunit [Magnetospirillum sp. XM-1]|uniref:sigma-70 family RNA polymerase sigma factor n=1 Tax=Magnetospirillum sp. XM-1 TaxID=1663591 RepID=UPI00073DD889|nr:sigma-70 family RNA polymerase sigma factor [Magnetospirillum sp. XM-1]CUW37094.1 putative DNA-directed RNA polymerase specialized sigma subunit [Magnetospirillum sp. XM-1]